MDAASDLRQAHRTAVLIASGLVTSLVVYAVVAHVFRASQSPGDETRLPEPALRLVRYAAWIGSAAVAALLPVLRHALLTRRAEDTRAVAIGRLTLATVTVGALAESPALAGFVLLLLGGLSLDFYLLGSLSLALLLANFPRYEAWEEWIAAPPPRP
jgi:hypothetical protein